MNIVRRKIAFGYQRDAGGGGNVSPGKGMPDCRDSSPRESYLNVIASAEAMNAK